MGLIATCMQIPTIIFLGWALDRAKVWKFLTFFVCLFITAETLFYRYSKYDEVLQIGQGSVIQEISFVAILWGIGIMY